MSDNYQLNREMVMRQLKEIATWPAEMEAVAWLKKLDEYCDPKMIEIPATLQLLMWAVETGAQQFGLDNSPADMVKDDLLYWSGMGHIKKAILSLLGGEGDPTEELPGGMLTDSPEEICWCMIDLANTAQG
jgi:hypothetical protein